MVLRRIAGVIAGILIAAALVQLAEVGVHAMNPFPPGMNQHDMAQIKRYVSTLPASAMVLVLAGWLIGTVAGTCAATWIGKHVLPGYITGAVLFILGIVNGFVIPQPVWFTIDSLVIYVIGTIIGVRLGTRGQRRAASATGRVDGAPA